MGIADHGRYNVVFEYPIAAISAALTATPPRSTPILSTPVRIGPLVCEAHLAPLPTAIAGVAQASFNRRELDLTVTDPGFTLVVNAIDTGAGNPIAITPQSIAIPTSYTLRDTLEALGFGAGVLVAPDGAGHPGVGTFTVDMTAVYTSPVIQALLVYAWFVGGPQAVEQFNASLPGTIEQALRDLQLQTLAAVTPFLLSRPIFITAGPAPVSPFDVDVTPTTIRLLVTLGGTPGNPTAITRSSLRAPAPGVTPDVAVLIVSNACLLRDIVRPRIAAAFGIPLAAFSSASPCALTGPVPSTLAGLPGGFMISNLQAGIDEMGFLAARFDFSVPFDPTGTLVGTFTQQLLASITMAPVTVIRFVTATPLATAPPPTLTTRIVRPWWVYLFGPLFAPSSAGLQALSDAINSALAGGPLGGTLSAAFGGAAVTIVLPTGGAPPFTTGRLSLFQGDAIFAVVAGQSTSAFRNHDLIINFA
jgi:hypothetical protein